MASSFNTSKGPQWICDATDRQAYKNVACHRTSETTASLTVFCRAQLHEG